MNAKGKFFLNINAQWQILHTMDKMGTKKTTAKNGLKKKHTNASNDHR